MGHCKVKCSLCVVQQVWWGLHWGRWQGCCAGGLLGVQFCRFVEISRGGGSTRLPQRTEPCQCVSGQPWACRGSLQGQMQPLLCAAEVVGPALGAAAGGVSRWFVGGAVLLVCRDIQRRRQHSATTAHRALSVCEWPALDMLWGTARSTAASAVTSRGGRACLEGCGRAEQVVCEV